MEATTGGGETIQSLQHQDSNKKKLVLSIISLDSWSGIISQGQKKGGRVNYDQSFLREATAEDSKHSKNPVNNANQNIGWMATMNQMQSLT